MKRTARFLLLFAAGMLVYFVGGYLTALPHGIRAAIKIALPLVLLVLTWTCRRVGALRPWAPAALALFAASCGFLAAWLFADRLLGAFGMTATSLPGIAAAKLVESGLIVGGVLLAARAGGLRPVDLYLRRGRVRSWLPAGLASFGVFAALFLWQWRSSGLGAATLFDAAPWIGIFVLANGLLEELHFRGLLLAPFGELLGRSGANLCIALFFTLAHAPVQYAAEIVPFLLLVFALAWTWGFLIQRTDSLWGAVLFHAGADLLIVQGIVETYGTA